MVFNSLSFLVAFSIFLFVYYIVPERLKTGFLFFTSILFYGCFHWKYVFLLLAVILIGYLSGRKMETYSDKKKKYILIFDIVAIIAVLILYKYLDFLLQFFESGYAFLGGRIDLSPFNILLPVGISFYTLLSLGYLIDIYRGKQKAERDFIVYGAFISFFPPLLSGPIERADNLLKQMKERKVFSEEKIKYGFCRVLWGYFQKVVIADRIAVLVTAVYDNYENYTGIYILIVTVLYAFQIYCDFAGCSNIAIGTSEMLGFKLRENFNTPYFSTDISEFWKKWHISLSSWLRDYVYISLGGNRYGRYKKYRNLILTFLVSGIWHGANFTFLFWGMLHGIYMIIFDIISPYWKSWKTRGKIFLKTMVVFVLVDFAWLFFRASSINHAFQLIKKMTVDLGISEILNREMAISMGMEIADILVLAVSLFFLILIELLGKKIDLKKKIVELPLILRWGCFYIFIFLILIFGYYGPGFDAGQFIYAQF